MKKLLIFSTLLLVTNTLFAQTYDYTAIVNSAEEKNKPTEYIEYFDNGKISLKTFKDKDGKLNGKTILYYENGNKFSEGILENGKENGKWVFYYENGNKKCEGILENGKKQGEWKWYLESGGWVNSTETYLNNVLHGPYKEYYGNLSYKTTGQFTNGKKDGIWKKFFENDQKSYEYYKDDNIYKIEHFYKNGSKLFEGDVTNGIAQIVIYTKAGKKTSEGKFDVTKKIKLGDWKYYDENGNLTKIETYKDGKVVSTKNL